MRAEEILKHNIDALLKARGQTRHDLAVWCRKSDAWLSKIFRRHRGGIEERRSIRAVYLDRIAEFFGLSVYQLFQPGISPLTERRAGKERRGGQDRRISAKHREAATPVRKIDITPQEEALLAEWRALRYEDVVRLRDWMATRTGDGN